MAEPKPITLAGCSGLYFDAVPVAGPNGEKMIMLNGVLYNEEDGNRAIGSLLGTMAETCLGPPCEECHCYPCILESYEGEAIWKQAEQMFHQKRSKEEVRNFLYRRYSELNGHGVALPPCIRKKIQQVFPSGN